MKYYVILPDGQRFGPADLQLLNEWAAEGRILPNSMLEQEGTQMRLPASSVPGLMLSATAAPSYSAPPPNMSQPPAMNQPQPYAGYYRPQGPGMMGDLGHNDLTVAWVCSSLGIGMCFFGGCCSYLGLLGIIGPIIGLIFSGRAQQKGNPGATAAKIFSGVVLGLQLLAILGFLAFFGLAATRFG